MALSDIVQPFVWGASGKRLTPDEIARQREIAQSLMTVDTSPVDHWLQGAARMANAFTGKVREGRADAAAEQNASESKSRIASLLAGAGNAYPSTVAAGASPTSGAATGTTVQTGSGPSEAEVRQYLIDGGLQPHIADGFVANFKDESGLDPTINEKNPIVPGSRGGFGLYQLTGPRRREYEAWSADRGTNIGDWRNQLDFMRYEGDNKEKASFAKILASKDTASAAQAVVSNFLRPAPEHIASRSAKYAGLANSQPSQGVQVASLDPSIGAEPTARNPVGSDAYRLFGPNADVSEADIEFAKQAKGEPVQKAGASTPQQAINMVAPQAQQSPYPEQGKIVPYDFSADPRFSEAAGMKFAGTPTVDPTATASISPQQSDPKQAARDALLKQHDTMFGGALAPQGQSLQQAASASGTFPPAPSATSSGVAQALAQPTKATVANGISPAILEALSSPYASKQEQHIAGLLLNQHMQANDPANKLDMEYKRAQLAALQAKPTTKFGFQTLPDGTVLRTNEATGVAEPIYNSNAKPTGDIRNYEYAVQNGFKGSFAEYQQSLKKAGSNSTTINNGQNTNKFIEESDKAAAGRMNDHVLEGNKAVDTMASMEQLLDMTSKIGTGPWAAIKENMGPYAQMFGIDVAGLDEATAFKSITDRLAPNMRPAGAGSSSDTDVKMYLNSLPTLWKVPGGNEIIANTNRGIAQNKMQAAEIAARAQSNEITWQEAEKQIRALPNPYENFKKYQKHTHDAKGAKSAPEGIDKSLWDVMTPEERKLWQ